MTIPEPFKIYSPEGDYHIHFEIDLDSLAFPIICKPTSFQREMIKFLNGKPDGKNHWVNVMLIEKNHTIGTNNVLPLLVNITFKPHAFNFPVEKEGECKQDGIKQFRDFIDQICASEELDYLFDWEKGRTNP